MTTGSPPCITATTELVVPRSIPIILLIAASHSLNASVPASPGSPGISLLQEGIIRIECILVKYFDDDVSILFYLLLWRFFRFMSPPVQLLQAVCRFLPGIHRFSFGGVGTLIFP